MEKNSENNFLPVIKFVILVMIILFSLINCGEGSFRKDPLAITIARYDNRSLNNVFLAHAGDSCSVLMHKRIHNILFLYPMNGYSKDEVSNIANQKMIRYKNILRLGDIFWNLLFFLTITTYSVEIDTCETGMTAIAKHDLDYLKENSKEKEKAERYKKELEDLIQENGKLKETNKQLIEQRDNVSEGTNNTTDSVSTSDGANGENNNNRNLNERIVYKEKQEDYPIVKNYKSLILKKFLDDEQPFSILFSLNSKNLSKKEKDKISDLLNKLNELDNGLKNKKIFLLGHTDWTGNIQENILLSRERAEEVSNFLISKGIPKDKIYISFSGNLWPDNSEGKIVKSWGRRVDILLLE